ncbi:MAG: flagellar hook protein FlgE [Alphaproteobacteria bacterium]
MSVFSALNVAVNGLDAQSRAFANVSDNLANTQTVGYKRVDTSFQSLVTASNANINNPGGVSATPIYQNSIQGNLTQVDSGTSLAIQGNGFFGVRRGVTNASGDTAFSEESFYTRRGDFALSKDGYLINGAGYYLTGYPLDADGNKASADPNEIRISQLIDSPVPTSSLSYAANLPAGVPITYASSPSTINVIDALGGKHEVTFTWNKDNGGVADGEWTLTAKIAGGGTAGADLTLNIPFNFDTLDPNAGTLAAYVAAAAAGSGIEAGTGYTVTNPASTVPAGKAVVAFTATFAGAGAQNVTLDFGSYQTAGGVTQFADSDLQVTTFQQNGIPRGSFQALEIDKNGFVSLHYDNGSSKIFYQVPIVQFYAPNNLQRQEGNAFSETTESGSPRLGAAGELGAGNIVGNALESSNVDIASEFAKMIQYQRTYSANSRVISTGSNMLEEIINVVR